MIKFRLSGTIVWVPPKHVSEFHQPGDLLFVVELEQDKSLVRVTVPNLDLRYPFETAYYPRKTLCEQWRALLHNIILHQPSVSGTEGHTCFETDTKRVPRQAKDTESQSGSSDSSSTKNFKCTAPPPDGYS